MPGFVSDVAKAGAPWILSPSPSPSPSPSLSPSLTPPVSSQAVSSTSSVADRINQQSHYAQRGHRAGAETFMKR